MRHEMMLEAVADILRRRATQGWLVGGTVRDRESGGRSPDLDLVVADDPAAVAREIAGRLESPWFALSTRHGAYRVMGPEGHVDVAGLRGNGILDDLAQRDFTVNAMAVPVGAADGASAGPSADASADGSPGAPGLVDPFGGQAHLREKRLVAVSDRIFTDDPLRLMRAVRFCHVLSLRLDPPLEVMLRSRASELVRAAPERVAAEMVLTLSRGSSVGAFRLWAGLGLLESVLPELLSGSSPPGPGWSLPVSTTAEAATTAAEAATRAAGTMAVEAMLERLDHALADLSLWFPESASVLSRRVAVPVDGVWTRPAALRVAAMTHRLVPAAAAAAGRRLRLSTDMLSLMRKTSECFSAGRCAPKALEQAAGTARSRVLFLWGAAPWEPESLLLAACADGPPATDEAHPLPAPEVLDPTRRLMDLWADREVRPVPAPPVDGEILMREFGLEPGPRLGEVLREVRLAREAGEAPTIGEAMNVAAKVLRGA